MENTNVLIKQIVNLRYQMTPLGTIVTISQIFFVKLKKKPLYALPRMENTNVLIKLLILRSRITPLGTILMKNFYLFA